MREANMHIVYILQSIQNVTQIYVGYTSNLEARLNHHNKGDSFHTRKYRPWTIQWYCAFSHKRKALRFEAYLKSHSGKAFLKKRLIEN